LRDANWISGYQATEAYVNGRKISFKELIIEKEQIFGFISSDEVYNLYTKIALPPKAIF
jgi:hypothetical protein